MSFFTYILYSESKDRYYIGSAEDVMLRLNRHNAGATPSTKPGIIKISSWNSLYL